MLKGLAAPPSATTPAARRAWMLEAPAPELVEALLALLPAHREAARSVGEALARRFGAPAAELIASPFAFRTALLAARTPTAFVPLELRAPEPGLSERYAEAGHADPEHMGWSEGRLGIGKYESFRQDDLLLVHNPNHHAKWTPHELLHRVHGYFWREDATAFEHYQAARLNELAPVALWYGLDELLRLDGRPFSRSASFREPECTPERIRWLVDSSAVLRERLEREMDRARAALRHFEAELDALSREWEEGRPLPVPHDFLDSCTDSLAYVQANGARLTDARFAQREACLGNPFAQRVETVAAMRERVEEDWDRLVFGVLDDDPPASLPPIVHALDRVQRSTFACTAVSGALLRFWKRVGEAAAAHVDPATGRTFRSQPVASGDGSRSSGEPDAPKTSVQPPRSVETADAGRDPGSGIALVEALGDEALAARVLASGAPDALWTTALDEGMAHALPATRRWLQRRGTWEEVLECFAHSPQLLRRISLARRVVAFLSEGPDDVARDLAHFEECLSRSANEPAWLPIVADVPWSADALEGGRLRANEFFTCCALEVDVLPLHDALMEGDGEALARVEEAGVERRILRLLIGSEGGDVRVAEPPEPVMALFAACGERGMRPEQARAFLCAQGLDVADASAWPFELVLLGALSWIPGS